MSSAREARRTRSADVGSFRRQLILSTAALGALVAVVLVVVVQVAMSASSKDSVERVLTSRADTVIAAAQAGASATGIQVRDADIEPGVAIFDARGDLVAGLVPASQSESYDRLAQSTSTRTMRLGDDFELLAKPFSISAGPSGVVVVSERLAPYDDDVDDALAVSIAAGLVIVVLATFLAAWASRRALEPVAQMARVAEDWSEHSLERRFDLGPPTNEIRALGHTLDALLGRVHRVILDEQRLTSELAHELRTPLASVLATAELIGMRRDNDEQLSADVEQILASCRQMAATITGLVDLARAQNVAAWQTATDVQELIEGLVRDHGATERVATTVPPQTTVALSAELAGRAIGPVLENALRLADHVDITAAATEEWVDLTVSDNGPGIEPVDAETIFEPGHSGGDGSGLGLALARRVARSAGGDVRLGESEDGGGAVFVVRLPTGSRRIRQTSSSPI